MFVFFKNVLLNDIFSIVVESSKVHYNISNVQQSMSEKDKSRDVRLSQDLHRDLTPPVEVTIEDGYSNSKKNNDGEHHLVDKQMSDNLLLNQEKKWSTFKGCYNEHHYNVLNGLVPFDEFLTGIYDKIYSLLKIHAGNSCRTKFFISIKLQKYKIHDNGDKEQYDHYIQTKYTGFISESFENDYEDIKTDLIEKYHNIEGEGSGWVVGQIIRLDIKMMSGQYNFSFGQYVKWPCKKARKLITNIKTSTKCVEYSLIAHFLHKNGIILKNKSRSGPYEKLR